MNLDKYLSVASPVEPWLQRFYNRNDSLTIFDIGACEGEESIRYAKLFPSSRIFSFEPLKNNHAVASGNLSRFGIDTAHLFNVALGDEDGVRDIYVSSGQPDNLAASPEWNYGNKSSSLLAPSAEIAESYSWLKFDQKESVAVRRLDTFCDEQGIDRIDFLHMDVQGCELKVLDGAGGMVSKIDLVWMEVADKQFYEGQPVKREVFTYMKNIGFVLLFENREGSYSDQLYASTSFYSKISDRLNFYTRSSVRWMNFIKSGFY